MNLRTPTSLRLLATVSFLVLARSAAAQQSAYDFSFIQLGDARVTPRFVGEPEPKEIRGEHLFRSIATALKEPQRIGPEDVPRPSFALCTGNLTEFGAPGETWKDVERLFGTLGMPWYPVAGQRDNAWNPVAVRIARAHPTPDPLRLSSSRGSPTGTYSFDAFGCHFVVLNCATIQDPRPVIDVEALNWLQSDLTLTARGAPVFLCLDQSPDSAEFAQPFQLRMLMDALDGANVALVMHGHGLTGARRVLEGLDCVTCGGMIEAGQGGERGYNLVSVQRDVLRVEYRSLHGTNPPRVLLTKSLLPRSQQSRAAHFEFRGTSGFPGNDEKVRVSSGVVEILESISAEDEDVASELTLRMDERPIATDWQRGAVVTEAERNRCLNAGSARNCTWVGTFDPSVVAPGAHLLTIEFRSPSGARQRTVRFYAPGGPAVVVSRVLEPLGSNRAGLIHATKGVRTSTAGYMLRMDDPSVDYGGRNKTVAGVLGVPAYDLSGAVPVLVTPSPDGFVCGLRADQDMQNLGWRYATEAPVYGSVLVAEGTAYVGDSAGRMHAIDLTSHAAKWVANTGGCSIEMKPLLSGDLLVFGAWDGFVYALNKIDGKVAWKQPLQVTVRSAADCTPVAIADRIFVCDGAGELYSFTRSGEPTKLDCTAVAAIAPSADGEHLYLRGSDDRLRKIKPDGSLVWDAAVELGSIPVAPVEHSGVVMTCSDRGRVTWTDAGPGRSLGTYQATPGAFVMAPLVVDEDGVCWVGGMDGSLTGLRLGR